MEGMKRLRTTFLLLALAGCAGPRLEPGDIALRVPFLAQPADLCGPAALAMVETHLGVEADFASLVSFLDLPALKGTIPELVAEAARRDGLEAEVVELPADGIPALLEAGLPPILLLGPAPAEEGEEAGDARGHFLVATGFRPSTKALRAHTGKRRDAWLAAEKWLPRYEAAGSVAVVVSPRGAEGEWRRGFAFARGRP